MVKIAPSILAADWSRLASEVTQIAADGADWIHLDVMDGHFVPPITFGPEFVSAIKKFSALPLDVHLMIERPEVHIPAFAEAGADIITVHQEACPHLHRVVQQIHELKAKAGVALNPATVTGVVNDIIEEADLILIMSVNPGWGGQNFIRSALRRIAQVKTMIAASGRPVELEVDGGINADTAKEVIAAGATALVAGTYVFKSSDYREAISALRS